MKHVCKKIKIIFMNDKLFIYPDNRFKIFWNFIIMIIMLFMLFYIPFHVCFKKEWNKKNYFVENIYTFSFTAFLFDLFLELNTG